MEQELCVIAVTEYYGGVYEAKVLQRDVQTHNDALGIVSEYNPDYDASVGYCRLSHNQSSPTYAIPATVIAEGDPWTDWGCLPMEMLRRTERWWHDEYEGDANASNGLVQEAADELGYIIASDPDDEGFVDNWVIVCKNKEG